MDKEYLAFRIDDRNIVGHTAVSGFFVRGQDPQTLNWPLLLERSFESIEDAAEYIHKLPSFHSQTVYGPDGIQMP